VVLSPGIRLETNWLGGLAHNLAKVEAASSSLASAEFDHGARELFFRENVTAFQVVANFARTLVSSMITSCRNYDCRNCGRSPAP
jgi:hypothetical protein